MDAGGELRGRLTAVSDTALTLEDAEGHAQEIPRLLVTRARLVPAVGWPRQAGRK